MSEQTPEEELNILEPEEYTTEPEDDGYTQDDNSEGVVSELMRENDINP